MLKTQQKGEMEDLCRKNREKKSVRRAESIEKQSGSPCRDEEWQQRGIEILY